MGEQILVDTQLLPTPELLQKVMGDNYANFAAVMTLLRERGVFPYGTTIRMARVGFARLNTKRKPYCGYRCGTIASNYPFSSRRKQGEALTRLKLIQPLKSSSGCKRQQEN